MRVCVVQQEEMDMDMIDEYYYGVRIFPGQDPSQVYVGWVTPHFHTFTSEFDMKKVRNVVVCSLDANFQLKSRCVSPALHLYEMV